MARRRKPTTPTKPFDGAEVAITRMERTVAYRTVTTEKFTMDDVFSWLWRENVVDLCKRAYNSAAFARGNDCHNVRLPLNVHCRFNFEFEKLKMLPPCVPPFPIDGYEHILDVLYALYAIHAEFNKVRRVVNWLDLHATPGAARFYFPGICALLPDYHVVHQCDGTRYTEPPYSMTDILPVMRDAQTTVAAGLLAPEAGDIPHNALKVQFITDSVSGEEYSQYFVLK